MAKLQEIIALLEKTIEQKRAHAQTLRNDLAMASMAEGLVIETMLKYLDINIDELERIVADLKTVELS